MSDFTKNRSFERHLTLSSHNPLHSFPHHFKLRAHAEESGQNFRREIVHDYVPSSPPGNSSAHARLFFCFGLKGSKEKCWRESAHLPSRFNRIYRVRSISVHPKRDLAGSRFISKCSPCQSLCFYNVNCIDFLSKKTSSVDIFIVRSILDLRMNCCK